MGQCLGWKYWAGAESTLAGVELCSMIKQGQMIGSEEMTVWEQFYSSDRLGKNPRLSDGYVLN